MNFLKTRSIDLDDTADQQPSLLLQKLYSKSWVRLHIRLNCNSKFKAISGLSRHSHTVSFTLVDYPGYVMTTRGNEMYGDLRPRSSRKAACCSFFPMPNLWFPGYISYESTEKSSHYIRIRDNLLFMDRYDGSADFKEDASFVMTKRQTEGLGAYEQANDESTPFINDYDDSAVYDRADSGWTQTPIDGSMNDTSATVTTRTDQTNTSELDGVLYQMDQPEKEQVMDRILQTATEHFAEPGHGRTRSPNELVNRFATLWRRHSDSSLPQLTTRISTPQIRPSIITSTVYQPTASAGEIQENKTQNEQPLVSNTMSNDFEQEMQMEFTPLLKRQSRLINTNRNNYKFTFIDSESETDFSRDSLQIAK